MPAGLVSVMSAKESVVRTFDSWVVLSVFIQNCVHEQI